MPPRIIAHRGASGYAPENTIAAFRKASELGFDWIETDCMLTKDGHVILHHDDTLERTTGITRLVSDIDYADLCDLDCGSWFDPAFSQERIPSLELAIDLFSELGMSANLELKPCPGTEAETARAVADVVTNKWPDHLPPPIISSFSRTAFETAWPLLPDCSFALLWHALPEDWHSVMKNIGADALHLDADSLSREQAQILASEGIVIRSYTVNSPQRYSDLLEWGVEAVFSDFPDRLTKPSAE